VLLLLARHGETNANRDRLTLGREDVPLNERGRRQARALASSLLRQPIVAVYSSPLRRALDTARAAADGLGLRVELDEGLVEMDVGEMEGISFDVMRERHGAFLRRWFSEEVGEVPMPGGESLRDVQDRAWAAIQRIRERHPDDTVLAVTHNFVILTLLCRALGLSLTHFRRFRQHLAATTTLDVRDDHTILRRLNDTCHLEPEGLLERGPWWRSRR
jgi:broad specificity phosphatase PhoE